ncbi:lincomycin resistance protein LmrB [Bifidobacterium sp. UTCIF-39]|uniref:DHA2 family efflux MFS transporter permease subunit n=1 Tax=Bifidobacterium sp. UTCIF-39 TaxID=1465359 RepID=UPI00112A7BCF|nr:DHA2 family efflux MFS transporter permease subunit [Bifidobacterium sp. UTCIF-39]TPF97329.1 lincomycin resistance protein LmrB [Bifidobacterium sp. UTCIF-39]
MTETKPNVSEQPQRAVGGTLIVTVVALALLTFLGILSETSLNIAYSALMEEFSISAAIVQWLTTGYLLLLAVAIPSSPFLVRRFPTKALFAVAVIVFSAGTLLGAMAINFPMLLAARLVMALGTGISLPLLTTIILDKAPFAQRGMMLGLVSLVTCAAPAIGPVFGGVVMEYLNWHWIFIIMLPFLAISFSLGITTVPDIRKGERGTISIPSLLLAAIGLSGIIVAVSFFSEWNGDWRVWATLAVAIIALAVFARMQLHMERPLVEVRTFTHPGFTLGILIILMSSGSVLGVNFLLPILLQRGYGETSMASALVLLPGAVAGAIGAPLIGSLLKKHYPPKFIICGFVALAVVNVALMMAGSIWAVAAFYLLFMGGASFVLVPDQTHTLNQLPMRLNADGSAVLNTVQQLAGAIGTAVASTLITEFAAQATSDGINGNAAYLQAFARSMAVFVGLAVVGLIVALIMAKVSDRNVELREVDA